MIAALRKTWQSAVHSLSGKAERGGSSSNVGVRGRARTKNFCTPDEDDDEERGGDHLDMGSFQQSLGGLTRDGFGSSLQKGESVPSGGLDRIGSNATDQEW